MEKIYILFQFECVIGDKEFEECKAIRFKYNPKAIDIEKEIDNYGKALQNRLLNEAWETMKPDIENLTVGELDQYIKQFYLACRFFKEPILKSEYQGWKEIKKAEKITLITFA